MPMMLGKFFINLGVKLSLAVANILQANEKIKQGHVLKIMVIVRACVAKVGDWPRLLSYAFWADKTTYNYVEIVTSPKLMYDQKLVMSNEESITS